MKAPAVVDGRRVFESREMQNRYDYHFPTGDPKVLLLGRGKVYLVDDFIYRDKEGELHIIRAGMVSDGESIPRVLWRVAGAPFTGSPHAAIVHDHYCNLANEETVVSVFWGERKKGDVLYSEILGVCHELGIAPKSYGFKYVGVRVGGMWGAFKTVFRS